MEQWVEIHSAMLWDWHILLLLLVCWYDLQAGHLDLVNDVSRNRSTKSITDRLTGIIKSSI